MSRVGRRATVTLATLAALAGTARADMAEPQPRLAVEAAMGGGAIGVGGDWLGALMLHADVAVRATPRLWPVVEYQAFWLQNEDGSDGAIHRLALGLRWQLDHARLDPEVWFDLALEGTAGREWISSETRGELARWDSAAGIVLTIAGRTPREAPRRFWGVTLRLRAEVAPTSYTPRGKPEEQHTDFGFASFLGFTWGWR